MSVGSVAEFDEATDPSDKSPHREYRHNLLIRDGRTRYHYDQSGRLIRKAITRLSRKADIWHYHYNSLDQLTDVWTPDSQWWHYTYDALGRRSSKQHLAPGGALLSRIEYMWDSTTLTEQTTRGATTRWHYEPLTNSPLAQTTDDATVGHSLCAVLTDLIGTPIELVDPIAVETVGRATTCLWGSMSWSGSCHSLLRFPGQIHDPETDLHYNFHRVYDPRTGRFLTQDPLGLIPAP
ncbi:RHS repeat-associated core domain-containing protein, partial [Nocardia crassostreae]|uniref:RHS repeat-associated core domain-containing protein n=1 Tax=Nocardia crassostreae TaxID=53428 RepID=UPI001471BC1D